MLSSAGSAWRGSAAAGGRLGAAALQRRAPRRARLPARRASRAVARAGVAGAAADVSTLPEMAARLTRIWTSSSISTHTMSLPGFEAGDEAVDARRQHHLVADLEARLQLALLAHLALPRAQQEEVHRHDDEQQRQEDRRSSTPVAAVVVAVASVAALRRARSPRRAERRPSNAASVGESVGQREVQVHGVM